ncbi:MAG: iron uptake system protein EfeO [Dehalococcoidia bacterium]|nr:iron uptake system protein EfeO [Dehalococcoidia bacterium]
MSRYWITMPVLGAALLFGCSADTAGSGARVIDVTLSDDGCAPRLIASSAGPTTFNVTNEGTSRVTEFEVMDGTRILGEVENVIPGKERSFSLTLKAGSYTTYCPGGEVFERGSLEVAVSGEGATTDSAAQKQAVDTYLAYVKTQADQLITGTTAFAEAVKANDATKAKGLFASARYHYEAIEPIAESFGDLDPAIDAREGDVPEADWGGFHRIEKALWVDNSLAGMGPVADQLVANVRSLRRQIDSIELEPAQIANGSVELLDEVSTSKITGEEDRYSHTDLSDFAGNLDGARAAFDAVRPLLNEKEKSLADDLDKHFANVKGTLDRYHGSNAAGNGYVLYGDLKADDTRALSTAVDALAERLSKVAAVLIS